MNDLVAQGLFLLAAFGAIFIFYNGVNHSER